MRDFELSAQFLVCLALRSFVDVEKIMMQFCFNCFHFLAPALRTRQFIVLAWLDIVFVKMVSAISVHDCVIDTLAALIGLGIAVIYCGHLAVFRTGYSV